MDTFFIFLLGIPLTMLAGLGLFILLATGWNSHKTKDYLKDD